MMSTDNFDTDFLTRLTVKRLAEMNKTRAKVDALERRAGLLAEYESERRKLDILSRLSEHYSHVGPVLRDMGHHVAELKAYLQSVYDADLVADTTLQALTTEHAVGYTVRLLDLLASDAANYSSKGALGVLELATSTLAMFSQRGAAVEALYAAGAVAVAVKLLSPLFPAVVVVNVANAVGNLASDDSCRLAFRAAGGIGALVRLLRPDVEATAQTAAAAALSLLAARDIVVQDSVRYLGGIEHLVELLASSDTYLSEVARYALLALRHGNVKNQAEIITTIRACPALIKDVRKLDAASELLRFEDGTPLKAAASALTSSAAAAPLALPSAAGTTAYSTASDVRSLIHDMSDYRSTATTAYRPPTADSIRSLALRTHAATAATPTKAAIGSLLTRDYTATVPVTPTSPPSVLLGPGSPLAAAATSPQAGDDWKISALVEVESELLRKKHLARFTSDEVALLLEEMGFDRLDLRAFRLHRVTGQRLLELGEDEMAVDLVLPRGKVRKLRALQRATATFDRIATLPRQGKVSEIELRLFLAGQGAGSGDVNKIVKLFRTLVKTDKWEFVTFWDFVTSYDWITQALRIYNIHV